MRRHECASIAQQQCGLDADGVQTALEFLNDTGEIVHLSQHKTLGKIVFLSPAWIIEVIRAIVSHKYEQGKHLQYNPDVAELVQDGLLEREFKIAIATLQSDAIAGWNLLQYAWAFKSAADQADFRVDQGMFGALRDLLVHFGVGIEHKHRSLLLPCYLPDKLDRLVLKWWPGECPARLSETRIRILFPMFQPAGMMGQLMAVCSEHMEAKRRALASSCAYMEAKHSQDQVYFRQERAAPAEDSTEPACAAIRITVRWKQDAGSIVHSILECARDLLQGWALLPHRIEVWGDGWQPLAQATSLLPTPDPPWYSKYVREHAADAAEADQATELFAVLAELRSICKAKQENQTQLIQQLVELCVQLARCDHSLEQLYSTVVAGQQRCVLSFLAHCVELGALGATQPRCDISKAFHQAYNQAKKAGTECGVAELCGKLGVLDVSAEFPGVSFPSCGHPLQHPIKARLQQLQDSGTRWPALLDLKPVLDAIDDASVCPEALCEWLGVCSPQTREQLSALAIPDLTLLSSQQRVALTGHRERAQLLLKDVLAPLTYCWFHAKFGSGFLRELRQPKYFIGKTVAPHMSARVLSWDPAACIQLQMAPSLQDLFTRRLHRREHYSQIQEPLSFCLETRHLSAHQPHQVTVGRVLQLLAHTRSIVLVMQQAVQHAGQPPEEEEAAVAEFLQGHHLQSMMDLITKVLEDLDQCQATLRAELGLEELHSQLGLGQPAIAPTEQSPAEGGMHQGDTQQEGVLAEEKAAVLEGTPAEEKAAALGEMSPEQKAAVLEQDQPAQAVEAEGADQTEQPPDRTALQAAGGLGLKHRVTQLEQELGIEDDGKQLFARVQQLEESFGVASGAGDGLLQRIATLEGLL